MKHFLLLSFLVNIVSSLFGQTGTITGHWRRVDFHQMREWSDSLQHGDLIIAPDSTYMIVGDQVAQQSETPGWNTGETLKGNWALHGKTYIDLYVLNLNLPLVYKIKKLTRKELQLAGNSSNSVMKYRRVQ